MHPALKWFPQNGPTDPYAPVIESFIGREFPALQLLRGESLMEAVVAAFLATKQYRYGPRPLPESEVKIRDVVRRAVHAERAIPILIPAAALKVPIGESIDLAELSALRVLECLQTRVTRHHRPGVDIRIRLEDLTELAISGDVPNVHEHLRQYTCQFTSLTRVLGYDGFITVVPESSLADPAAFLASVDAHADVFRRYLDSDRSDAGARELAARGWAGGVSADFYRWLADRYVKLYPGADRAEHHRVMARYLAAILARRDHRAVGADPSFDGRLEISFAPPLPDAPAVSTRVQYRSVPLSQSSNHTPYWAAKGHLRINGKDEPRIALGPWTGDYTPGQLELRSDAGAVTIRADYVLED